MAYNLTYDTSDDPQALSEAEARDQESYEIGERLEQEQNQLLAGKYRDAEELEQAYIELQRKLGDREPEAEAEQVEEEEEDRNESDYGFLNQLAEEADGGEFSEETLAQLEQMSSTDIAQMFLAYRQEMPDAPESYEMSSDDIAEMKGVVGGDQQYQQIISWAAQNLSEQEIAVYDSVMDKGDPQAIYFAIQALNYKYQDAYGTEGRMLTGNAPKESADVFRSQAEVVRAMSDSRYDVDPAYRQDIYEKLERSNVNF